MSATIAEWLMAGEYIAAKAALTHLDDMLGARQRAVRGVDDHSQRHEPEQTLEVVLFNAENTGKSDYGAASGVEMHQPSKEDAPGHSLDYVAEAVKLALAFRRAIHAMVLEYFGSTGI